LQAQREVADVKAKRDRDAHSAQRKTRLRLVEDLKVAESRKQELDEFIKDDHLSRAKALLHLKRDTENAQAEMATELAPKLKAVRQRELARAQERRELDAAGRNADAIFAVRDEAARMKNRAARLKANTLKQEMLLLDQLILEDARARKVVEIERVHESHLASYRAINGPSIISKFVRGKNAKLPRHGAADSSADSKQDVEDNDKGRGAAHFPRPSLDLDMNNTGAGVAENQELEATDSDSEQEGMAKDDGTSEGPRHIPNAWNEHRRVLQQRKVASALVRQQERLRTGEPLSVCGKTYDSSKFLSQPQRIIFKDFVVGKKYQQKVVLTNVSFAFNSLKMLALPDEFTDYFDIIFKPPGRMSAGTTNTLTVIFKPKLNMDIITELPLLAETGPFSIPLLCFTCKAVIAVSPPLLELGAVVLGDSETNQVVITNDGKRAVPFVCRLLLGTNSAAKPGAVQEESKEASQSSTDVGPAPDSSREPQQAFFEASGSIGGYSEIKFPVEFKPVTDGSYSARLRFDFGTEADRQQPVNWGSEHSFVVEANGKQHSK
jgi:hypothetical protein